MKIVHIIPGSGGTFYCENCMRDGVLIKALQTTGHEIIMVPMYLPLFDKEPNVQIETPIFYGAINIYLKQKIPFFRKAPRWIERILDSPTLLNLAAKKAGSTRASGLEDMTISMLRGEEGDQAMELEKLISWLAREVKPDVVHLSNVLLLGLARRMKKDLAAAVVCSLQDEDQWVDSMESHSARVIWQTLAKKAVDVDAFIAVSRYYATVMQEKMQIPPEKMHVVHIGINLDGYQPALLNFDPPVIGYLSRLSECQGLKILVEAFIKLRQDSRLKKVKLRLTGGQTGDDRQFLEGLRQRLDQDNLLDDVEFIAHFDRESRLRFVQSLSVMSVPVRYGEAFGVFQIEALASGVPLVQPNLGAFPEIIEATGGGIIYEPNDADSLARSLTTLLLDPGRARELGRQGRDSVHRHFSVEQMAKNMIAVYEAILK